jgi:hypothetical protein
MQESKLRVITPRTTIVIRFPIEIDPPLWNELVGVGTPEVGRAVNSPWGEDDLGSDWDVLVEDCGWVYGVADCDWDCGVEAESFVANGVE